MQLSVKGNNSSILKRGMKKSALEDPFSDFYYKELAQLTAAGSWKVDFLAKKSYLDEEGRRILKVPENFRPSLNDGLRFYAPEEHERVFELYNQCATGTPFSTTVKMLSYDQKLFWARATGNPIFNEKKEVIGIRGVFQDMNAEKVKQLDLQNSLSLVESQNKRLINFAHIVSHNLRSHASNLQLTLELLKSIEDEKEEAELMQSIYDISKGLNATISHLSEVASVQNKATDGRKTVRFEEILQEVLHSLNRKIIKSEAQIYYDFSELEEIAYVPAYMESILLNLITNAIKYKHPDRVPSINIFTYTEGEDRFLKVQDNGLGIDLEKYGDRIFNMYQTFHDHEEAVGVGLFITKNQIEILKGTIMVESEPQKGSTFTIKF
ncbi:PAS domain-containing sensor histidine kinase [Luteirhabdus pelagi]|uniref:PAS domain-containing sensor histidine kinase n=1 Tax=Luteirhabdus pelagi TaxID=2792783 RepID=UPI001939F353|nr:PAS domain-containing sensor histidine kinase [Luteirhabdus pelagi]